MEPYETDYTEVLNTLVLFIENTQAELSLIDQISLFLGNDRIKGYINDSLHHYTFKQIFHDATEFFNLLIDYKKDYNLFRTDYKEYFLQTYNTSLDTIDFDSFVEKLYLMLNARKKSRLSSGFKKQLSEFAVTNKKDYCYLCGRKSINKLKEINFSLDHLYSLDNESLSLIQKALNDFEKELDLLSILDEYDISEQDKIDITKKLYSNINFNHIRKKYDEIYKLLNSNVLEIEHLHPVGWGGSKTSENLLSSCHGCNHDKKDLAFYTDYSINRFFVNYQEDLGIVKKRIYGNLGPEALISLKMKQGYKCFYNDCNNDFSDKNKFYLVKEEVSRGYHFFNLRIVCDDCLINNLPEDKQTVEYIKETFILL